MNKIILNVLSRTRAPILFYNRNEAEKIYLYIKKGKKDKPLLIYGPPGTGKTAAVRSAVDILKKHGTNVVLTEVCASDNVEQVLEEFVEKHMMRSIDAYVITRVLFINELDSFSADEVAKISHVIERVNAPVVLEASDIWQPHLSKLRQVCERIEFKPIPPDEIERYIKALVEEFKIDITQETIRQIVENANGDMRAAIIDLFTCKLPNDPVERNVTFNLFAALKYALESHDPLEAKKALESTGEDIRKLIHWLCENIVRYTRDLAYDLEFLDLSSKMLQQYHYGRAMDILATVAAKGLKKPRIFMPITVGPNSTKLKSFQFFISTLVKKIS
ncbi:MAG: AAA family ATPase, partial [Candidatus Korarchaeota archaeon]